MGKDLDSSEAFDADTVDEEMDDLDTIQTFEMDDDSMEEILDDLNCLSL